MAKKRKARVKYNNSELEALFLKHWKERFPEHLPVREFRFHAKARYRFDFAWVDRRVAVEIQGFGPAHFSVKGMSSDHMKLATALTSGWKVVYFTSALLKTTKYRYVMFNSLAQLLNIKIVPKAPQPKGYVPFRKRKR